MEGLSPRVRGNRVDRGRRCVRQGSIPACAGEPQRQSLVCQRLGVYPRVCGGTPQHIGVVTFTPGLSPRVRGNHKYDGYAILDQRSIPACAGEPTLMPQPEHSITVYPRVCGGTAQVFNLPFGERGLSPRVRGNLNISYVCRYPVGSIPACAGEPSPLHDLSISHWVYPRVCGGTRYVQYPPVVVVGLSPRVRGNRVL